MNAQQTQTPDTDRCAANRANSLLSTGPRTPEGKQASAKNALRHGLTGRTVLLPSDDLERYAAFCESFKRDLKPVGPLEESLVQNIADSQWRLERIAALEANVIEQMGINSDLIANVVSDDPSPLLLRLSLYSQRINRILHTTLNQLRAIQKERRALESQSRTEHKPNNISPSRPAHGFVFSTPSTGAESEPDSGQSEPSRDQSELIERRQRACK